MVWESVFGISFARTFSHELFFTNFFSRTFSAAEFNFLPRTLSRGSGKRKSLFQYNLRLASRIGSSHRPNAFEHFDSAAGHEYMVGLLIPAKAKIATEQMDQNLAVRPSGQHTRHANRTRTGSAGPSFSRAAFPGPLAQFAA